MAQSDPSPISGFGSSTMRPDELVATTGRGSFSSGLVAAIKGLPSPVKVALGTATSVVVAAVGSIAGAALFKFGEWFVTPTYPPEVRPGVHRSGDIIPSPREQATETIAEVGRELGYHANVWADQVVRVAVDVTGLSEKEVRAGLVGGVAAAGLLGAAENMRDARGSQRLRRAQGGLITVFNRAHDDGRVLVEIFDEGNRMGDVLRVKHIGPDGPVHDVAVGLRATVGEEKLSTSIPVGDLAAGEEKRFNLGVSGVTLEGFSYTNANGQSITRDSAMHIPEGYVRPNPGISFG